MMSATTGGSPGQSTARPALLTERDKELHRDAFYLALFVLLFGVFVLAFIFGLSYLGKINTDMTFKLVALALIITVGAYLIPAGFSVDQVNPLFGLLGVVAGYVLSQKSRHGERSVDSRTGAETSGTE